VSSRPRWRSAPLDARLGIYREMQGNIGTITLRRTTEASDSKITVLAQTKTGEWREISFLFEPECEDEHLFWGPDSDSGWTTQAR